MKVSIDSLNKYLKNKLSTERMVELLLKTEVEVEEILPANSWDKNIVVVRVQEVEPHPDADRLRIARVSTGVETIEVVCGGPNLAVGQVAVLAKVGTTMPDGLKIKAGKIRGVVSNGMLCAADELGLSDDHSGILVLPDDTPLGATLCDIWQKGDCLDIKTPANRWDFLSLTGLAREVAAQDGGNELVLPDTPKNTYNNTEEVDVKEVGECKRFVSVKMRVDNSVKSPQWLVDNLEGNGLRSISPVVDITNFVMLETGHPSHAFDAKKVHGRVSVRYASPAETITTLDSTSHKLTAEDLVIADSNGPLDIAGVMGGAHSEVSEDTTEILLTVANFDRTVVRKAALRHGTRSEASARYERSLPLPLTLLAADRLTQLLKEVCGAEVLDSPSDQLYGWPWIQYIGLRLRKAEKLLGVKLDEKQVVQGLKKLGYEVEHFSLSQEAKKHIGKPYLWGANFRQNGEDAFDCSYLLDRIYSKVGIMIGHTAQQQFDAGTPVEVGELKPGDVLFYSGHWEKLSADERGGVGHNGMYLGGNEVLEAVQYKYNAKTKQYEAIADNGVRISPLTDFTNNPSYLGARRYVDSFNHILAITVPWWRTDVRQEEDIVEEIVKIIGYDAIPAELPTLPATNTRPHQLLPKILELKKALVASGLQEIVTYSFISERMIEDLEGETSDFLEIANPLSREQQYLRRSILPNHLEMVANNQRYAKQFTCFEVARVYEPVADGELPKETWKVGVTVAGKDSALRLKAALDFLAAHCGLVFNYTQTSAANMAPGRHATIRLADKVELGGYGQVSKQVAGRYGIQPEVSFGELSLEPLLERTASVDVHDLPDYQLIKRDISLVCSQTVAWTDIEATVTGTKGVKQVEFIGLYQENSMREAEQKNITLRAVFDLGANPTSDDIAKQVDRVARALQSNPKLGTVTIN